MTREEAIYILYGIKADNLNLNDAYTKDKYEALGMAIQALQADRDLISRQAVLDAITEVDYGCNMDIYTNEVREIVKQLPTVAIPCEIDEDTYQRIRDMPFVAIPTAEPNTEHWRDFAVWVAKEIFDDEWEYNKDAFAEIACRKLNKLGIVKANGDEWELVEPQESEE